MADAVGARVQRKSLNLTDVTVCRGKRGRHCADINSGMGTNTVGQCCKEKRTCNVVGPGQKISRAEIIAKE